MSTFEDALREQAPNFPEESYLAPGWKWSVRNAKKVRKGGGTYMEVMDNEVYYHRGRNRESGSPGDLWMQIPTYPYMYLIMLTHLEDEIRQTMREKQ